MSRFGHAVGVLKQRRGRSLTTQRALSATPRSATCSCVRVLCVLVLYVRRELGATVPWCIWPGEDPACWGYELRRVVFARAFGNKKKTRHTVYSIAPESLVRCAHATAFQEWPPTVSQPPRRAPHFGGTAVCKIDFAINCPRRSASSLAAAARRSHTCCGGQRPSLSAAARRSLRMSPMSSYCLFKVPILKGVKKQNKAEIKKEKKEKCVKMAQAILAQVVARAGL